MEKPQLSADTCREWLIDWVVSHLEVTAGEINLNESLLMYGMDSVNAIMLVGDLESHFELRLPPTLVWDHPTVNNLIEVVQKEAAEKGTAMVRGGNSAPAIDAAGAIDQQEAARLLENIDQLSEAEVDRLLKRLAEE